VHHLWVGYLFRIFDWIDFFGIKGVTPMFAICFFGYGIGKKLQTPSGEHGEYTYVV